jgi:hypothetical protein
MKTSLPLTMARRLGIGLAICVPALVVAQTTLPNFGRNQVLQADQLNTLVSALNETRSRVDTLQANAGVAFRKENLYPIEDSSEAVAQNGSALAQASCADNNDLLVGCSCEGRESGGANSLQFDLRRVTASNRTDGESFCVCQGVNVGTNVSRVLFAVGQCLRVP